jgi:hypothetical protein
MMIDEDAKSLSAFLEYTLYHLFIEKEYQTDYPQIFTLSRTEGSIEFDKFGDALKGMKDFQDLKEEDILYDVRNEVSGLKIEPGKVMDIRSINKIADMIMDKTDSGLMLYYGSSKISSSSSSGVSIYLE